MTIKEKLDIYNKKPVHVYTAQLDKLMKVYERETGSKAKPGQTDEWAIRKTLELMK